MEGGFSWKQAKKDAIEIKIRRAITQVSGDNPNQDIAIKNPNWVSKAQQKDYTDLKKSVTQLIEKQQERAMARRLKVARK